MFCIHFPGSLYHAKCLSERYTNYKILWNQISSHLKKEDADKDEEGDEEDGPLAELQEGFATEKHFPLDI